MPYRPRLLRNRRDELSPTDLLELSIGEWTPELEAMWQRHGAGLMRADTSGERFSWPRECYGTPPGWTQQDERERAARQAETEAGRRRKHRQYQVDEESA